VLKQPQYQPMPLEEQVAVLFAAINGYVDSVPPSQIARWKEDLLQFLRTAHPEVLKGIYDNRLDRKFPPADVRTALENALKEFNQTSTYSE
jgi:F-type H+-transporting ATPase subunit alpha